MIYRNVYNVKIRPPNWSSDVRRLLKYFVYRVYRYIYKASHLYCIYIYNYERLHRDTCFLNNIVVEILSLSCVLWYCYHDASLHSAYCFRRDRGGLCPGLFLCSSASWCGCLPEMVAKTSAHFVRTFWILVSVFLSMFKFYFDFVYNHVGLGAEEILSCLLLLI